MRRNDTGEIGDLGEEEALCRLFERGYTGRNLNDTRNNAWTYDLEVFTRDGPCRISVKTARAKRDISLGSARSLERLQSGTFVMILMPRSKNEEIVLSDGGYHLWIIPSQIVREEALDMHWCYWGEEYEKGMKNTVRVKDKRDTPRGRDDRSGRLFADWNRRFSDAWHLLPAPWGVS